jgi:hypothetical protein
VEILTILYQDIINFYDTLYPEDSYRYYISDMKGETIINKVVESSEEIAKTYKTYAKFKTLNHYISVNTYTPKGGKWPMKTGIITKVVIDLDDKANPDNTIKDARKLVEILNHFEYKVIINKSGRKGLHIHLKTTPLTGKYIDNSIKQFFLTLAKKLDISTMDEKVISDQTARIIRLPGSNHPITQKPCKPVDIFSSDKIEEMIEIPINQLQLTTGNGSIEKSILQQRQEAPQYKPKRRKSEAYNLIETIRWDIMDKVFQDLYESGENRGNRWIVKCPFHDDNNPSAFYTENLFHCSSCNISIGVYKMLTEHSGYSKGDAMKIIKQHQNQ